MANYSITPRKGIDDSDQASFPDKTIIQLFKEIQDRHDYIVESKAFLENAPLGNEFQVDDEKGFNGLEQLRDMSRNNYAKLIVSATTDRLGILGFRTAAAQDETGDEEALLAFERDDMGVKSVEAMALSCGYRGSYLLVDPLAKRQSVVPPTNGAVIHDRFGEPVAALVVVRDRAMDRDFAHLYLRGIDSDTGEAEGNVQMFIASREIHPAWVRGKIGAGVSVTGYDTEIPLHRSNLSHDWVWWKQHNLKIERVPVTALPNKDRKSEFEDYTDVINRINHMIFQRVIIATMQAFRQRAVKGDFPSKDPVTGADINYEEMFNSGPAQMWTLPADADIWESTPPSYQELLEAVKEDRKDLASQTYTPMSYFSDAATNSAEGAALQRENHTSKIEDRKRRFSPRWGRHLSIYFEIMEDEERSEVSELEVIWGPSAIESMTNKVASFVSLKAGGLALSTALREAMGMTPKEINRAMNEVIEEKLSQTVQNAMGQATPLERSSYGQTAETQSAANNNTKTPSAGGAK